MDTREKIIDLDRARELVLFWRSEGLQVRLVTGWFDPLLAQHARRLEALNDGRCALLVVVTDPPEPLLPRRAREELVAALRPVNAVLSVPETALDGLAELLGAESLHRFEQEDRKLRDQLIRHVHRRHSAG